MRLHLPSPFFLLPLFRWLRQPGGGKSSAPSDETASGGALDARIESAILSAFLMATNAGPMCEEPMQGVAVVIESVQEAAGEAAAAGVPSGMVSGQVMAAVREGIRDAFMACSTRVMLAVYSCVIQATGASAEKWEGGKEGGRRRVLFQL